MDFVREGGGDVFGVVMWRIKSRGVRLGLSAGGPCVAVLLFRGLPGGPLSASEDTDQVSFIISCLQSQEDGFSRRNGKVLTNCTSTLENLLRNTDCTGEFEDK